MATLGPHLGMRWRWKYDATDELIQKVLAVDSHVRIVGKPKELPVFWLVLPFHSIWTVALQKDLLRFNSDPFNLSLIQSVWTIDSRLSNAPLIRISWCNYIKSMSARIDGSNSTTPLSLEQDLTADRE